MKNIKSIDKSKNRKEVQNQDNSENETQESIIIFKIPKRIKKINNKTENNKKCNISRSIKRGGLSVITIF